MTEIIWQGKRLDINPGETVLDCLLRNDIDYPHSCQSGICQSCLIKASAGDISADWQQILPETLKANNYFLACLAKPNSTITLAPPEAAECEASAKIMAANWLNHNVICLKLTTDNYQAWTPGQYLNLITDNNITRSYSIANLPATDGYIELHIKTYEQGEMSNWLTACERTGAQVQLRGPFGQCFYYNPDKLPFAMVLAGTGTGLAPLLAIARSALAQNHLGQITLIHGGLSDDDLYGDEQLSQLAQAHDNFDYIPCVLNSDGCHEPGSIDQCLVNHIPNPQAVRVYVCGPQVTTNKLKTKAFLKGVASSCIYSDAFL